jgi:hypothetical protein
MAKNSFNQWDVANYLSQKNRNIGSENRGLESLIRPNG